MCIRDSSSFARGFEKTIALQKSNISDGDSNLLGMNNGDASFIQCTGLWPLLKLAVLINRSYVATDRPILSNLFDPYTRNIIAPDHLLTGLATNLLDCCMFELKPMKCTKEFELRLRLGLRTVGVEGERCIYSAKTNKLVSISMSTKYALLLVLPFCLRAMRVRDEVRCFPLICLLQEIVSLIFWWPSVITDGKRAVQYVHGTGKEKYHRYILLLVKKYVNTVNQVCKMHPSLITYLDKPNVHRLL